MRAYRTCKGGRVSKSRGEYIEEPRVYRLILGAPQIMHLNGVPWFEAPIPRRLHRCWAQTIGFMDFTEYQRCACGSIRRVDDRIWLERNSRKAKNEDPVPATPYIERKQAEVDQLHDQLRAMQ